MNLGARVTRLENVLGGGPQVRAIVRMIEGADDEALDRMTRNGTLGELAKRLGNAQLDRLIGELQVMRSRLLRVGGNDGDEIGLC